MNPSPESSSRLATLRSMAVARLTGADTRTPGRSDASDALGVLFELASAPATAQAALALLHELQVHQVEVDLQDEELRRSRRDLETSLRRQCELYDYAPVGYVTIDREGVLCESNLTAAGLLACERDFLLGRSLQNFLAAGSPAVLQSMLDRLAGGAMQAGAELELQGRTGRGPRVHASARPDPMGNAWLLALTESSA